MATDQVRNEAWYGLLEIVRLTRYYEALSDKYRRNNMIVRFLLLAAAASGIAAMVDLLPATAQRLSSGLVALLVMWDFVSDYAKKAAILHAVSVECSTLENEWRELWVNIDSADATDESVQQINRRLSKRLTEVTSWAGHADIREDRKLNEQCEATSFKVMRDRYA